MGACSKLGRSPSGWTKVLLYTISFSIELLISSSNRGVIAIYFLFLCFFCLFQVLSGAIETASTCRFTRWNVFTYGDNSSTVYTSLCEYSQRWMTASRQFFSFFYLTFLVNELWHQATTWLVMLLYACNDFLAWNTTLNNLLFISLHTRLISLCTNKQQMRKMHSSCTYAYVCMAMQLVMY